MNCPCQEPLSRMKFCSTCLECILLYFSSWKVLENISGTFLNQKAVHNDSNVVTKKDWHGVYQFPREMRRYYDGWECVVCDIDNIWELFSSGCSSDEKTSHTRVPTHGKKDQEDYIGYRSVHRGVGNEKRKEDGLTLRNVVYLTVKCWHIKKHSRRRVGRETKRKMFVIKRFAFSTLAECCEAIKNIPQSITCIMHFFSSQSNSACNEDVNTSRCCGCSDAKHAISTCKDKNMTSNWPFDVLPWPWPVRRESRDSAWLLKHETSNKNGLFSFFSGFLQSALQNATRPRTFLNLHFFWFFLKNFSHFFQFF